MKFVKRVISLFLVGILLASMGVTEVLAVGEEDKVTLAIEADKADVRVGETVTFTVSLKNAENAGVASVGFELNIPTSLKYISSTIPCESLFTDAKYNASAANFLAYGAEETGINDAEWIIMTATYEVQQGAVGNIPVSFINNDLLSVGDTSDEAIDIATTNCTITVPKAQAGTPVSPVVQSTTDTSITVRAVSGQQYMIKLATDSAPKAEDSGWQTTGEFTGLNANTAYRVYTYIPETTTTAASSIVYTEVTTSKAVLTDTLVQVSDLAGKIYNGQAQEPTFGGNLTEGEDYSVTYEVPQVSTGSLLNGKPCGAGTYTVTVSGMGNYQGSFTKEFTITPKSVEGLTIAEISPYTYDGTAKTPAPAVTDGTFTLTAGQDFEYSYRDNTYVGTATVTITGKDNYQGTKTAQFTISTGTQSAVIEPSASLRMGGNTLDLSTLVSNVQGDAEIAFSISAGEAATLSGSTLTSTDATGTVTISVSIAAVDVNEDGTNEYAAKEGTITVAVTEKMTQTIISENVVCTYGDTGLSIKAEGYRGELSYSVISGNDVIDVDNLGNITVKTAGTATVQLSAAGDENYSPGTKTVQVTVNKRSINVVAEDKSMTVGGALPELTVRYENMLAGVTPDSIFDTLATASTAADGSETGTFDITVTTPVLKENAQISYQVGTVTNGTLTVNAVSQGGGTSGGNTTYYAVQLPTNVANGEVTVSPSRARQGQTVTICVTPDEGYALAELTVTNANDQEITLTKASDTQYTFVMPRGSVSIEVSFELIGGENVMPFTDVASTDWFADAVRYVYDNNIMAGTGNSSFAPQKELTRAEVVQILYNLEGQPTVTGTNIFHDTANHWALNPIIWAKENGVVEGYEDNTFRPNQPVSRQEFAQMLYNYTLVKGYDSSARGDLSAFPDGNSVASWAEVAMSWANGNELINGHDNGTIDPTGTAIRAHAASILMNFDLNLVQ